MRCRNSPRTRSITGKETEAPSSAGSTKTRKGRRPGPARTMSAKERATAEGWGSSGTRGRTPKPRIARVEESPCRHGDGRKLGREARACESFRTSPAVATMGSERQLRALLFCRPGDRRQTPRERPTTRRAQMGAISRARRQPASAPRGFLRLSGRRLGRKPTPAREPRGHPEARGRRSASERVAGLTSRQRSLRALHVRWRRRCARLAESLVQVEWRALRACRPPLGANARPQGSSERDVRVAAPSVSCGLPRRA